tara:strand:+ start:10966 stop:13314 length:2349 start_codon:yes stop_codon:yes gene_type:complete
MAIRYLTNIDLTENEIQNVKAQNLASDPTGYAGQFIFNTTSNTFKYYNGSSWISLDGTGDIAGVNAGAGLSGGGSSGTVTLAVDYAGSDNIILEATNDAGNSVAATDKIMTSNVSTNTVEYHNVSDLPFTNTSGTVTSVALTETGDALTITGSPITSSGTLNIAGAGTSSQVICGDLSLATLTSGTVTSIGITPGTGISVSGSPVTSSGNITVTNTGVTSIVAGSNISISGGTGAVTISASTQGDITAVTAGDGLTGGGSTGDVTVSVDYSGSDNIILTADDGTSVTLANTDKVMFSDATDDEVKYANISQLTAAIGGGTVTSVAASAANGLTVSGTPITTSGTLAFGISAGGINNDRLANSTISGVSLGSNLNSLSASTGLTMTSYNGSAAVSNLQIDYSGTNNAIEAATDLEGTAISSSDVIWYSDATDNNIKKGLVSDLPFDASGGTVTSIATPADGGLTGGTITTSGSLRLKNYSSLSANKVLKWDNSNNQLTDSILTDDGSTVTIAGNLTVNGTTTTIDSTTVSIKDNMMEYASGNDVAGGGANSVDIGWFGNYVISSTDYYPVMFYDASASSSASSPVFRLGNATTKPGSTAAIANVGKLFANIEGSITGNADTASALATARTIALTGDGSWSVSFDGSSNVTGALTLDTVNSTTSSQGGAGKSLTVTANAKGLVTAITEQAISITASQVSDFCTAVATCIGDNHSYAQNIGNGSATSYTVTHNLGTRDVSVQCYDNSSYDTVYLDVVRTNTNSLTLSTTSAIASNDVRVLVSKVG